MKALILLLVYSVLLSSELVKGEATQTKSSEDEKCEPNFLALKGDDYVFEKIKKKMLDAPKENKDACYFWSSGFVLNSDVSVDLFQLSKGCRIYFREREAGGKNEVGFSNIYCRSKPGKFLGMEINEFGGGVAGEFCSAELNKDAVYHGIFLPKGSVVFPKYNFKTNKVEATIAGVESKDKAIRIGKKEFKGTFNVTDDYQLEEITREGAFCD